MFYLYCVFAIISLTASQGECMDKIVKLQESPYEVGYSHGKLLKEQVRSNVNRYIDGRILENSELPQIQNFLTALPEILQYVSQDYKQEMKGLADGAELPYEKILLLNLFPEMFHCTGLTVHGHATSDKELYHVRVLDYAVGQNLQDSAVLFVIEPEGKIPFLNVSYAGFIGCITGMNAAHIALGEIGGKGYGEHAGVPMAFLLRSIIEKSTSLDEVKEILLESPRTCEYYYVFSDGKKGQSIGVYATADDIDFFEPGETYALFDRQALRSDGAKRDEKWVLNSSEILVSDYQTIFYLDREKGQHGGLVHRQPKDCLAITGFSNPQRYPILMQRLIDNYGRIGVQELCDIIKAPVSNPTNLHNAIFAPATLDVWIAHAGPQGEPAYERAYEKHNLNDLLGVRK